MAQRKATCVKFAKTCLAAAVALGAAIPAWAGPSAATAKSSPNAKYAQKAKRTRPKAKADASGAKLDAKSAEIMRRMKAMRLPKVSFAPPATLIDVVDFFRTASAEHDSPEIPEKDRGFSLVLRLKDPAAGAPAIPRIAVNDITFYDALKLVCDITHYKFVVTNGIVMIQPDGAAKNGK